MRNMSFSLTTEQFLDGSKTVTRRLGWRFLKPGEYVRAVKKSMGLKKGEKIEPLGFIRVLSVTREPLMNIRARDTAREGFADLEPWEFVDMFCQHMGCSADTEVTRIEFQRMSCSDLHTQTPPGYLAWRDWADAMAETHKQEKCPLCGRYAIWVPK